MKTICVTILLSLNIFLAKAQESCFETTVKNISKFLKKDCDWKSAQTLLNKLNDCTDKVEGFKTTVASLQAQITNCKKKTAKPKPRLTPKPTPLKQFIHVEHEVLPTEAPTPAPSGFADKFAACARLDFLNKAACEVKLCFSNPSAQECKREPSVQDRQRR